jgi:hypothetical protein
LVKIAGYWDVWFQHRESEYDISWRFMIKHFGVNEIILMPNYNCTNKIPLGISEVSLIEMNNITDVLTQNPNLTPIIVDERGNTPLKNFIHPENALYIFGRTGYNPSDELDWKGQSVFIESIETELGNALLHPNQACSIILYDRMQKSWQ